MLQLPSWSIRHLDWDDELLVHWALPSRVRTCSDVALWALLGCSPPNLIASATPLRTCAGTTALRVARHHPHSCALLGSIPCLVLRHAPFALPASTAARQAAPLRRARAHAWRATPARWAPPTTLHPCVVQALIPSLLRPVALCAPRGRTTPRRGAQVLALSCAQRDRSAPPDQRRQHRVVRDPRPPFLLLTCSSILTSTSILCVPTTVRSSRDVLQCCGCCHLHQLPWWHLGIWRKPQQWLLWSLRAWVHVPRWHHELHSVPLPSWALCKR